MSEGDSGDGFGSEHRMVIKQIRDQVDPDAAEREAMRQATGRLRDRVITEIESLSVNADVIQVGSTARGTWLAGDRDIDLFIRFPADLNREALEEYGLRIGNAVLPSGHEEYAEHPYITGRFEGFEIDLVPCYNIDAGSELQSAVDRTPHHNRYLQTRIDETAAAAVRVLKKFLKGTRVYGSDLRTRGFSGYLTELLVMEYGDFEGVLKAAAKWQPPIEIDPEEHATATHDDPLIVVDPTDPTRNVAAVCSATNVSRLQHYARQFLTKPTQTYFESPAEATVGMDAETLQSHLQRRGTSPIALVFDSPDIVDDQLYPQLQKSIQGIQTALETEGFDIVRTATFADDKAVLLLNSCTGIIQRLNVTPVHQSLFVNMQVNSTQPMIAIPRLMDHLSTVIDMLSNVSGHGQTQQRFFDRGRFSVLVLAHRLKRRLPIHTQCLLRMRLQP